MATQKKNSGNQVKGGVGFGSGVRSYMGGGSNVANSEKSDAENVPWSLIVVVMEVQCISNRHIGLVSLRHSNDFALYCAVSKLIEFGI